MSKRRNGYTSPSVISSKNVLITIAREVHPEELPNIDSAVSRITAIGGTALETLPRDNTRLVPLLHSDTVRQLYSQRTRRGDVIDTTAIAELENQLNDIVQTEAPLVEIEDELSPFRIDNSDTLVASLRDSNMLRVDRFTILRGITEVIKTRKLCVKDIDGLLFPIEPGLPVAKIKRRMLGSVATDPIDYLQELASSEGNNLDDTEPKTILPTSFRLGRISIIVSNVTTVFSHEYEEHIPGVNFDGVKKISNYDEYLEYA